MKKTLVIRAPLLSLSGYGVHCRQIFKYALHSNYFSDVRAEIVPWGQTTWLVNPDLEDGLVGKIMERTGPIPNGQKADVSMQVQLPNEWDANLAKFNVGVTAGVETNICNTSWVEACNRMDAVIFPSKHTQKTIQNSGTLNVKNYVVPESYIEDIDQEVTPMSLGLDTDFNFLTVGQITGASPETDRKNIFYLIKWFCEEFKDDKDVGLIVKTNSGKATKIDKKMTKTTMQRVLEEVRPGEYPKVHLLHGSMTSKEMASLYKEKSIKAFLTITRGEGFGLPILEAAASGIPVIATNWSAQTDYLSLGKFIPLNYRLNDVHQSKIDGNIFVQGAKWAEVDESDFKKKIKKFRNNSALPKKWADDLKLKICEKYSQKSIEMYYDNVFRELLE